MKAERRQLRIPLSRIFHDVTQIFSFPNAICRKGRLIFAMPPLIIDNAVKSEIKIDLNIFQGADTIIRIPMGKDDIPGTFLQIS